VSVPRVLLLILALLQATGIAELVRRQVCETECRDDGCKNDCTPGDDAPSCPCHCPSSSSMTPPAIACVVQPVPTEGTVVDFEHNDRVHRSPDPREILHVPKHGV
jgi:hypothetical protein